MTDFETEFVRRNVLCHALAMAPCLLDESGQIRGTAEASLIRHLPTMRKEDAAWIAQEQVRALVAGLDPGRPELTVAILDALCHVGDSRALPTVKEIFARAVETDSEERLRIRDAAYSCMVHLNERAAKTRVAASLLRGSARPVSGAGSALLRPADGAAAGGPAELLRAAEPEP